MARNIHPSRLLAAAGLLAFGLAPGRLVPPQALAARDAMRSDAINATDYDRMERGYYEQILDAGRDPGSHPDADAARHAEAPPFDAGPLADVVPDARQYVLKPALSIEHWGVRWSTNTLGMRDREYAAAKPQGTFRVALMGDSITSGWGVDDGRGYEPILEREWDARSVEGGGPRVEVLNFAVPGHAPGQRWEHARRVALATMPDTVIYQATLADLGWDERRLRVMLPRGQGWDAPAYRQTLEHAGARPGQGSEAYKRLLRPIRIQILEGVYREIVAGCREKGLSCAWVLIPRVGRPGSRAEREQMVDLARAAGFSPVLDLSDVYDGVPPESIAIKPSDYHPNADGHARLARRIDGAIWGHVAARLKDAGGDR
ncbi:SGNH/GDSL hydrolase family protein [Isosphaeraceae bacterium EP7]